MVTLLYWALLGRAEAEVHITVIGIIEFLPQTVSTCSGKAQLFGTDSDYVTRMGKVNGSTDYTYIGNCMPRRCRMRRCALRAVDVSGYATDIAYFGWTENYCETNPLRSHLLVVHCCIALDVAVGAPRFGNLIGRVSVLNLYLTMTCVYHSGMGVGVYL